MIDPLLISKVNALSVEDRIDLIGAIWDALPHAQLPVSESERRMLDARLSDAAANPSDQSPLSEVIARLEKTRH